MPDPDKTCSSVDCIVVGGGPAGSTVATRLAEFGHDVLLLEKDRHPRFHIGESLLPLNVPLFDRLGVLDEVKSIGMPKWGVDFTSPKHRCTVALEFGGAWDKGNPYSFQVRRSEFDHILLQNAARKGVAVMQGQRVQKVDLSSQDAATVSTADDRGQEHTYHARFLIDASGRDTLLANRLGLKERNRRHASAAIYGHFANARRQQGRAEGNISIFWFPHGWIWFIPLSDGTTSVGAVCPPDYIKSRTTDVTSFFHQTLSQSPELSERLKDATLVGPATATGNYSYRSRSMYGSNYLLVGDAYAFIDPVFSSGVYIAMAAAFGAADAVSSLLKDATNAERVMSRFQNDVNRALDRFSWFIYRMNRPAIRDLFMNPRNYFRIQEAILSLLSGEVFGPSPVHQRLTLFKGLYYVKSAANSIGSAKLRLPASRQPLVRPSDTVHRNAAQSHTVRGSLPGAGSPLEW